MSEDQEPINFLKNFDGYVLIICALVLSALKVIELILKKKQNNNFTHLNTFENDLKKLQNEQSKDCEILMNLVELSRIQTTDSSPEIDTKKQKIEDMQKRFSKSASILKKPDA